MTMISMSGLDLSFMHGSGGGTPRPPRRPARAARPQRNRPPAEIIDLAAARRARGLKPRPLSKSAKATITVSPTASAKVKRLAKDLGIKLAAKPRGSSKRRPH